MTTVSVVVAATAHCSVYIDSATINTTTGSGSVSGSVSGGASGVRSGSLIANAIAAAESLVDRGGDRLVAFGCMYGSIVTAADAFIRHHRGWVRVDILPVVEGLPLQVDTILALVRSITTTTTTTTIAIVASFQVEGV